MAEPPMSSNATRLEEGCESEGGGSLGGGGDVGEGEREGDVGERECEGGEGSGDEGEGEGGRSGSGEEGEGEGGRGGSGGKGDGASSVTAPMVTSAVMSTLAPAALAAALLMPMISRSEKLGRVV